MEFLIYKGQKLWFLPNRENFAQEIIYYSVFELKKKIVRFFFLNRATYLEYGYIFCEMFFWGKKLTLMTYHSAKSLLQKLLRSLKNLHMSL